MWYFSISFHFPGPIHVTCKRLSKLYLKHSAQSRLHRPVDVFQTKCPIPPTPSGRQIKVNHHAWQIALEYSHIDASALSLDLTARTHVLGFIFFQGKISQGLVQYFDDINQVLPEILIYMCSIYIRVVITPSNITSYCIHICNDWGSI